MKRCSIVLLSVARCGFAVATGCLPYNAADDPAPPIEVPDRFTAGEETVPPGRAPDERWWVRFDDPGLQAAIDRALEGSFELRAAFARIREADAIARQLRAGHYPQAAVVGTASYGQSTTGFLGRTTTTQAAVTLPVSYEIDLFNRVGAEARAAELEAVATREDLATLATSIAARVAEAWYDLVENRRQRILVTAQLQTNETYLELTRLRFEQGLTEAVDVYQQRQQVASSRAALAAIDSAEALLIRQLAVLTGEPGGSAHDLVSAAPTDLPDLPPPPPAGVPAELLEGRADLRAARRRVEAADRRVGAAIDRFLPQITLNGLIGYSFLRTQGTQSTVTDTGETVEVDVDNRIHGFVWNVGGTVTIPLFDGFGQAAEVSARRARVDQAVEAYGTTVQTAIVEVETALIQEQNERRRVVELSAQLEAAGATLEAARDRYRRGLTDFLPVLTSLQSLHATELTLLAAQRDVLTYRIQLYRALGGTWPADLEAPERRPPS